MIKLLISQNFLENFFANLFADILVAIVIGIFITKYLDSKDKRSEHEQKEKERKEKLKIAANMLWSEIEYNRGQLKLMIVELAKPNLIYPALEISAWEIIDKKIIMDGLKVKDFADLLHIYNRIKTINMMYYSMLDKVNWIEDVKPKPVVKGVFMSRLIKRCEEALSYINEVIPEGLKDEAKKNKK